MATQSSQYQVVPLLGDKVATENASSTQNRGITKSLVGGYIDAESGNIVSLRAVRDVASATTPSTTIYVDGGIATDISHFIHGGLVELTNYETLATREGAFTQSAYLAITGRCVYQDNIFGASGVDAYPLPFTKTPMPVLALVAVPSGSGLDKRVRIRPKRFVSVSVGSTITVTILSPTTYDVLINGVSIGGSPFTMGVSTHTDFEFVFENNNAGYTVADSFVWRRVGGFGAGTSVVNQTIGNYPLAQWWVRINNITYFIGPGNVLCACELVEYSGSVFSYTVYTVSSRILRGTGLYVHEGHLFLLDAAELTTTNQYVTNVPYVTPRSNVVFWSDLNVPELFTPTVSNEADVKSFTNTKNADVGAFYNYYQAFRAVVPGFGGIFTFQDQLFIEAGGLLYRGNYVGLPLVYQFTNTTISYLLPGSIQQTRYGVFALTHTDVVMFNGISFEPVKNIAGELNVLMRRLDTTDNYDWPQGVMRSRIFGIGYDGTTQSVMWSFHPFDWLTGLVSVNFAYQPKTKSCFSQTYSKFALCVLTNRRAFKSTIVNTTQSFTRLWYRYFRNGATNQHVMSVDDLVTNTCPMVLTVHPFCVAQNLHRIRELFTVFIGLLTTNVVTGTITVYTSNRLFDLNSSPPTPTFVLGVNSTTDAEFNDLYSTRVGGRFFGFVISLTSATEYAITALECTVSKFDADK